MSELFENRKIFAENLVKLFKSNILSDQKGITISITGKWGTGKTFFMEEFEKILINNFVVIKYDAWKTDYDEDVIPTLVEAFIKVMKKENYSEDEIKKFMERAKRVLIKITPVVLNSIMEKMIGIQSEIIKKTLKESGDVVTNKENESSDDIKVVENFKEELNKFMKEKVKMGKKKVIVLVDELDRCRPNHSLAVLESIKHFFDIENFIFIIFNNKDQLISTIKHVYGITDPEFYLEKFYDYQLELPVPNKFEFIDKIFQNQKEKSKVDNMKYKILEHFIRYFKQVSENFSFREVEKIAKYYEIISEMYTFDSFYQIYSFPQIFLKHCYRNNNNNNFEFPELINNTRNFKRLYKKIFQTKLPDLRYNDYSNIVFNIATMPMAFSETSTDYYDGYIENYKQNYNNKIYIVHLLITMRRKNMKEIRRTHILYGESSIPKNLSSDKEKTNTWLETKEKEEKKIASIINIFPELKN